MHHYQLVIYHYAIIRKLIDSILNIGWEYKTVMSENLLTTQEFSSRWMRSQGTTYSQIRFKLRLICFTDAGGRCTNIIATHIHQIYLDITAIFVIHFEINFWLQGKAVAVQVV